MSFRDLVLLAALGVATSCGTPSRSPERSLNRDTASQPLDGSIEASVDREVAFAFRVVNRDSRVEVMFPSGQTHDFVVMDSTGRELWRWSEGRMFTQALQTRVLDRGDTLVFRATWDPATLRGRFTVLARLLSSNYPLERRTDFVVP